ncbi:hypothetical protein [Streptomyces cinereoruber]|uniref:hypothetical protein n=1 Tax=Streptomyces cinereoruber TaxID=67260 RepID=UPI00363EC319
MDASNDAAQSGIGIVRDGLLLDGTERTVVRGPFRSFPHSAPTGRPALSPGPRTGPRADTALRSSTVPTW